MMYEQALEDYEDDYKNRGGFLLIPKPAGLMREPTTTASAAFPWAPPSSVEETQDAYVRSFLGTSSFTMSCAPPTSYEEAQEDYDNDIAANDAHMTEYSEESTEERTLVYVKKEGCACWYCGNSNSASAQNTPTVPCIPPSSYEEAQEDYQHQIPSVDDTSADATVAQNEVESTKKHEPVDVKKEGYACWYCGGVVDYDGEAAGKEEDKDAGCVACYKRSAMCFLPRSKLCRGMIC